MIQNTFAQQPATDAWLADCCQCFSAFSKVGQSSADLEHRADSCARAALLFHYTPLLREQKMTLDSDSTIAYLGERLSRQLYERCDAYRDYFYQRGRALLDEDLSELPHTTGFLMDIYPEIGGRQLLTLWCDDGRLERFLWARSFDGEQPFLENPDAQRRQKMTIVWDSLNLYDSDNQRYTAYKEIKRIRIETSEPALTISTEQEAQFRQSLRLTRRERRLWIKAIKERWKQD